MPPWRRCNIILFYCAYFQYLLIYGKKVNGSIVFFRDHCSFQKIWERQKGKHTLLRMNTFFCPILQSSLPLYGGGLTLSGTLLYLGHVHPWQILCCRLSVIADDAVVAVLVVELGSRIYMSAHVLLSKHTRHRANLFRLRPFHSEVGWSTAVFF